MTMTDPAAVGEDDGASGDLHRRNGDPASPPRPDRPGASSFDIDLHGLVRLRLIDPTDVDRHAVEAQFGPSHAVAADHPTPADITLRYQSSIPQHGRLRYLGPGELGFTDDGFLLLRGRFRRPVTVLMRLGDLGGPVEVVCEHGVGRVPHLVALVNLAILGAGGLALHASAYAHPGQPATLVTGWSKGGKSEALLAAGQHGARYVADEWTHLHADGQVSGIVEPVRTWDWHLRQYPRLRRSLATSERSRLAAFRWAEAVATRVNASARVATTLRRQRFVDLPARTVTPAGVVVGPVPLGSVFLMTSTPDPHVEIRPIPTEEVAARMAASLTYERMPLTELVAAHRYAFPSETLAAFDTVPERERARLCQLLDGHPAAEVLHPYPVDLHELDQAMTEATGGRP